MQEIDPKQAEQTEFTRRLDFYWQYIAVYAVALLIYLLLKGTIESHTFSIVLLDPVVILLAIFIIGTSFALLFHAYKKRSIIVGSDFIIFRNRLREKKYTRDDIVRIAIGREKMLKIRSQIRVIKIIVKGRRRTLRVRPSSFWNDRQLAQKIKQLKLNLKV